MQVAVPAGGRRVPGFQFPRGLANKRAVDSQLQISDFQFPRGLAWLEEDRERLYDRLLSIP